MAWTTEKIKQLKKLWSKGKSTVEIGKELGISKNAVVGKVHRLELEARPSPIKKQEKPARPTQKVGPDGKTQIGLLDLKMNSCRWPIGDPKDADFHFCGATAATGKPYCPEHCKIAYTSLKELTLQNAKAKKEKAAQQAEETEKQTTKPIEKVVAEEKQPTKSVKATKSAAKSEAKAAQPNKAEIKPTKSTKTPAKQESKPLKAAKAAPKPTSKKTVKAEVKTPVKATKEAAKTAKASTKTAKSAKTVKEPAKKKTGKK